jgi:hypothetical protein
MNWLAPWLLVGLLALALPIWAHLLGRAKPRIISFAGLRFAERTAPPRTKRRRISDPILLMLRLLALALVIMAMSQPMCNLGTGDGEMLSQAHDAIVLVDRSASTMVKRGQATLAQEMLHDAETLVRSLPAGSNVALVSSAPHEAVVEMGSDRELVLRRLHNWQQELVRGQLATATSLRERGVTKALEIAAASRAQGKIAAAYVYSDHTASGYSSLADFRQDDVIWIARDLDPLPSTGDESKREMPTNLAIVAMDSALDAELGNDTLALHVQVRAQPRRANVSAAHLCLRMGDANPIRSAIAWPTNSEAQDGEDFLQTTVTFHPSLANATTSVAATAFLCNADASPWSDVLSVDDSRAIWLHGRPPLRLALVNGAPSEVRTRDEVYFIGQSMRASFGDRGIEVHTFAPDVLQARLEREGQAMLADFDAMLLANVAALSASAVTALQERLEAGFGLWIAAGDHVVPADYNAVMSSILPATLREAAFVATPGRDEVSSVGLGKPHVDHVWLRTLSPLPALAASQTKRILLVEPPTAPNASVAWSYDHGAPALLTRQVGRGQVALLTTTLDLEWSDLAVRPGFVPFSAALLRWLASASNHSAPQIAFAGRPVILPPGPPTVIVSPSGRSMPFLGGDQPTSWRDTYELGHYRAETSATSSAGDSVATPKNENVIRFATQLDPVESDLTSVAMPNLRGADEGDQAARGTSRPLWRIFGWLALALLALESALRLGRRVSFAIDKT